jgi:hypothetical protein
MEDVDAGQLETTFEQCASHPPLTGAAQLISRGRPFPPTPPAMRRLLTASHLQRTQPRLARHPAPSVSILMFTDCPRYAKIHVNQDWIFPVAALNLDFQGAGIKPCQWSIQASKFRGRFRSVVRSSVVAVLMINSTQLSDLQGQYRSPCSSSNVTRWLPGARADAILVMATEHDGAWPRFPANRART